MKDLRIEAMDRAGEIVENKPSNQLSEQSRADIFKNINDSIDRIKTLIESSYYIV